MRESWRIHPELDVLDSVLESTYGVLLTQEQVLHLLNALCGWDYTDADLVLGAMRKKDHAKLAAAKPGFFQDGLGRGHSQEALNAVWETLLPFADYSFSLAHSTAYAYISYQTAYLKRHHPEAYMAALLSAAKDADETAKYVNEAKRMGIPVLGPDINESKKEWAPTERGIRYGLRAIKGVGDSAADLVVQGQPYGAIDQFFRRADPKVLNSNVLSALAGSGALDSLWSSRTELLEQGPGIGQVAITHRRAARRGQHPVLNVRYRPNKTGAEKEDSGLRRSLEEQYLGLGLTWPTITIRLTRPLTGIEWVHIRTILASQPQESEIWAELGKTRFRLPLKSMVTPGMIQGMSLVDAEVRSE